MWRASRETEQELIVEMVLRLYAEDPSDQPIGPDRIRRTLATLRSQPARGRAVVHEVDGGIVGYAILVSFWSNEYGGEICIIDELWIDPARRGQGRGTSLFDAIERDRDLWPEPPAALELEVTSGNVRARSLYERLGFRAKNTTLRRRLAP